MENIFAKIKGLLGHKTKTVARTTKLGHKLNWHPSLPNKDVKKFSAHHPMLTALPASVDLRPMCPPIVNQGDIGSCHDDQTEVLTVSGFKLFKDITKDDKLASVSPETKELIFEYPTNIVRFNYTGPMHYVDKKNSNFAVTPDHKMVVRKWDVQKASIGDNFSFVEMKDIGWYSGLPCGDVKHRGEAVDYYTLPGVEHRNRESQRHDTNIPMSTWMKFLGIYLAEGTILQEEGHYKFQLAASKEREKTFIREVMAEMNITTLELDDRFTFDNKQLYTEMEKLGLKGVKAPQKFVPEMIFKMTPENIKYFLLGHFMGDGCEQNGVISHYTSSEKLANDLHRLIFLSGGWGTLGVREPRAATMSDGRTVTGNYSEHRVSQWKDYSLSLDKKEDVVIKDYSGEVFCAEVPTFHTLVTRREGKILISGNCTANSLAGAMGFLELQQLKTNTGPEFYTKNHFSPVSRLFIYWNERVIEGTTDQDAGAQLFDGIKTLATTGAPREFTWPYLDKLLYQKPSATAYTQASSHKISTYFQVETMADMKNCLASGFPFVFGFTCYEELEADSTASTGILPMPGPNSQIIGGHAVLAVGYDDAKQMFLVRNSWGTSFGLGGYFWMPYQYLGDPNLASDMWKIQK